MKISDRLARLEGNASQTPRVYRVVVRPGEDYQTAARRAGKPDAMTGEGEIIGVIRRGNAVLIDPDPDV